MDQYLKDYHYEDITNLLNDNNDSVHVSINVDLTILQRINFPLFNEILTNTYNECIKWDRILLEAQKLLVEGNIFLDPDYQIKENCHVRFINLPFVDPRLKIIFPTNDLVGQFVQVKGNVVRMTQAKLLEYKREYICSQCKQSTIVEAEYNKMFVIEPPKHCKNPNKTCKGTPYQKSAQPQAEYCIDFQEIRIQELLSEKHMPASLVITLDNDQVDCCQPGDCVTVCGTIELRWKPLTIGKRSEVILSMRAISVIREEKRANINKDLPEHLLCVRAEWQDSLEMHGELGTRDLILQSICPEVHGMYMVKLAIALALCSSVGPLAAASGTNIRGNSHLLLVGDPGLAKSRLLKYAANIAVRSVHTTGMGCSAAGLTAAAIKEDGEWQLEAGALVLADGGICCIDEFNLMRESDKASIHEAMEQQTISMAKAGLVCKLSTRCVVLAATNPKNLYNMCEQEGTSTINIGIASPLLSRFDIVLILRDERNVDWDNQVADHVLNRTRFEQLDNLWSMEKLQSHFMAIRDMDPELTTQANDILGAYYKACRADDLRDASRTSVRLLDSIVRLAQAHARLVFRNKVTDVDAVAIIRLMESSWGFGRVLKPLNILKQEKPFGPTNDNIQELMTILHLGKLNRNKSTPEKTIHFNKLKNNKQNQDLNVSNNERTSETNNANGSYTVVLQNSSDDLKVVSQSVIAAVNEITINKNVRKTKTLILQDTCEDLDEVLSLDFEVKNKNISKNHTDDLKDSKKRKNDVQTREKIKKKKPKTNKIVDSIHNIPGMSDNLIFEEFVFNKKKILRGLCADEHRKNDKSPENIFSSESSQSNQNTDTAHSQTTANSVPSVIQSEATSSTSSFQTESKSQNTNDKGIEKLSSFPNTSSQSESTNPSNSCDKLQTVSQTRAEPEIQVTKPIKHKKGFLFNDTTNDIDDIDLDIDDNTTNTNPLPLHTKSYNIAVIEKPRVSPKTINKLNVFKNIKYQEVVNDKNEPSSSHTRENEHDSAYDTLNISHCLRNVVTHTTQSSSFILASQQQDLACLDDLDF